MEGNSETILRVDSLIFMFLRERIELAIGAVSVKTRTVAASLGFVPEDK